MTDGITVVKLGGSTLGQHDTSLDDIAALHAEGERFVIVHGGGGTVTQWLELHGIESTFVGGLRATDGRALEVVVAVLAGLVNKQLVAELLARGSLALGFSGADGAILRARRYDAELGFVGEIVSLDGGTLLAASEAGVVPVLAPIAIEVEGEALRPQLLNVNADTVAGEVASALAAERLVFLTDVAGVLDGTGELLPRLSAKEARRLLEDGTVTEGMIPKVEAGVRASATGVTTLIADGREAGALRALLAADGEAVATRIR